MAGKSCMCLITENGIQNVPEGLERFPSISSTEGKCRLKVLCNATMHRYFSFLLHALAMSRNSDLKTLPSITTSSSRVVLRILMI